MDTPPIFLNTTFVYISYLAYQSFEQKKQGWIWILGITALIYNPFFRVHLNREIWSVVNVVTTGIAGTSIFAFIKNGKKIITIK